MEYIYTPIELEVCDDGNKSNWKYIIRQIFISSGPWSIYFVTGLCFGTPAVMIPQLRKEANCTAAVSDEMASWLSSIYGYSSLPWTFILPILSEMYGRKLPFQITSIVVIIGQIIWYFGTTLTSILVAEIIVSIVFSCNLTLCVVIIVEYSSPRYRGILLTMKSATLFWGIWVANIIGTFCCWRNIVILGFLCTVYSTTSFFWPESPHWLASQGRFKECVASHRIVKGISKEAEHELCQLIISQRNHRKDSSNPGILFSCERIMNYIKIYSYKVVYKPILLSLINMLMYQMSGKLACSMYAIEILKKITGDESAAYKVMLILDAVSLIGMYFGCYLTKRLKRRIILITSTVCSILFLFMLSLYLYLIKVSYAADNNIVSLILLTLFSISISCGPMLLSLSIFAELIPLRYKGSAVIIITLFNNIMLASVLKVSPIIFKSVGLHGGFLFYGVCVFLCLIILYKYLPETKDKTLIEIEEYFRK